MSESAEKRGKIELREIHENPTLDEVWDLCVRNFLYDPQKYVGEVENIFNEAGIDRNSRIADVSAGGGFPSIELIRQGYNVDCFDGFSASVFDKNAKESGVDVRCKSLLWQELPNAVSEGTYDFLFCRGNSFIFADGGWKGGEDIDRERAMGNYLKTLKIFAGMLKKGGHMYVDKFKDAEPGHREKLATIKVGGQNQDLVFWSQRFPERKTREVFMERVVADEVVVQEKRATYDLSEGELLSLMEQAGFSKMDKVDVQEEKHFDVWLAQK